MILRVPSYYKEFACIADRCRDSCCIGWEIDIDEDTFSYYKNVEGTFGKRLREHMMADEVNSFTLRENGWCPFLNEQKLCDICIELGEEALCEVCTEYPRFTMEYENVREKVLSLSCEEVGRILFSSDKKTAWEVMDFPDMQYAGEEQADTESRKFQESKEEAEAYGPISAQVLEKVRDHAVDILQNRSMPVFQRAAEYLSYCSKMQEKLFGIYEDHTLSDIKVNRPLSETGLNHSLTCMPEENDGEDAADFLYQSFLRRMESFERLEVLDAAWSNEKKRLYETFSGENYAISVRAFLLEQKVREYEYEQLLVYFTNRYFMRAYYDDNIFLKAQFAVVSLIMIRDMDVMRFLHKKGEYTLEDRIDTARIYSKEVEHSEENMEILAEEFQFERIYDCDSLIRQL